MSDTVGRAITDNELRQAAEQRRKLIEQKSALEINLVNTEKMIEAEQNELASRLSLNESDQDEEAIFECKEAIKEYKRGERNFRRALRNTKISLATIADRFDADQHSRIALLEKEIELREDRERAARDAELAEKSKPKQS